MEEVSGSFTLVKVPIWLYKYITRKSNAFQFLLLLTVKCSYSLILSLRLEQLLKWKYLDSLGEMSLVELLTTLKHDQEPQLDKVENNWFNLLKFISVLYRF